MRPAARRAWVVLVAPPEKALGWPAYVVSAVCRLRDPAVKLRLRLDGGPWRHPRARSVVVGNVGALQAGAMLLPDAGPGHRDCSGRHRFRRLELRMTRPDPHELEGDDAGRARALALAVDPGALLARVPE